MSRLRWADLTEEQKQWWRDNGSNGCGPKGGWIKPPHRGFFKASCDAHDFGYSTGGTEKDRMNCDAHFFGAMVVDAAKLAWWKRFHFLFWSWLYFRAVRWGGKKSFIYGEYRDLSQLQSQVAGNCWRCGNDSPGLKKGTIFMCWDCSTHVAEGSWEEA